MPVTPETTSINRLPNGQYQPGTSGNPNGRPKGSMSIRDASRQFLDEHPEEMEKLIRRFLERNPEFFWQMMEGAPPKAVVVGNLDGSNIQTIAPGEVLKLAEQINNFHAETEIHSGAGLGSNGALPSPVGSEARAQDEQRPTV